MFDTNSLLHIKYILEYISITRAKIDQVDATLFADNS